MKALPYYKFYWQDWRASRTVQRMDYITRGLYRSLLDECWAEGSIPTDMDQLADICDCPTEVLANAWQLLSKCFREQNGVLVNIRLDSERTELDQKRVKLALNGKKGGEAKLSKVSAEEANAKQLVSNCHIEEKSREENIITKPSKPRKAKKDTTKIPAEFLGVLTDLCKNWPSFNTGSDGEKSVLRKWTDPVDLWEAMVKNFPNDDKRLMINCGLVHLANIKPKREFDKPGFAYAMCNFYGPKQAHWKKLKGAVQEAFAETE